MKTKEEFENLLNNSKNKDALEYLNSWREDIENDWNAVIQHRLLLKQCINIFVKHDIEIHKLAINNIRKNFKINKLNKVLPLPSGPKRKRGRPSYSLDSRLNGLLFKVKESGANGITAKELRKTIFLGKSYVSADLAKLKKQRKVRQLNTKGPTQDIRWAILE